MFTNKVKELWQAGKPVATAWCCLTDPYSTEAMVRAGFDALILDAQHGMSIGPDQAARWLQIVGQADVTSIVRVPWNEPAFAQAVLDSGAQGVIVPMISTVEEAKKAIGACRYPPVGYRSGGPNRARFYGLDYFDRANDEILCLLMMETVSGIENLEEIAQIPGCDGYFVGPGDLAFSLGIHPREGAKDPRHAALVQRVIDVARAHGQNAGIWSLTPEESLLRCEQGFNLNPAFNDIRYLIQGAERSVDGFRQGAPE